MNYRANQRGGVTLLDVALAGHVIRTDIVDKELRRPKIRIGGNKHRLNTKAVSKAGKGVGVGQCLLICGVHINERVEQQVVEYLVLGRSVPSRHTLNKYLVDIFAVRGDIPAMIHAEGAVKRRSCQLCADEVVRLWITWSTAQIGPHPC